MKFSTVDQATNSEKSIRYIFLLDFTVIDKFNQNPLLLKISHEMCLTTALYLMFIQFS